MAEETQYPALVIVEEKKDKDPFIIKLYPFKSSVECLEKSLADIRRSNPDFL